MNGENTMTAYCGLICTECPAYIATQENDEEKIAATAVEWSKQYGMDITPEQVWCDGCLADGRKCGHCAECEVRACAVEKDVENCGNCAKYKTCDTIEKFIKIAPPVKEVLEEINKAMGCS